MNKKQNFNSIYELFPKDNKIRVLMVYSMLPNYSKYVMKKVCGINLESGNECGLELTEKETEHLYSYVIPFIKENIINISKGGYLKDKSKYSEINQIKNLHNFYTRLLIDKFGVDNYRKANLIVLNSVRKKEDLDNKQQLIDYVLKNENFIKKKLSLNTTCQSQDSNNYSPTEIKLQKICNSKLFVLFDKTTIIKTVKITMILNGVPYTNKLSVLVGFLENNLASVLYNLRKQLYIKYEFISSATIDDTDLLAKKNKEVIQILLDDPQIKWEDLSYLISIYLEVNQSDVDNLLDIMIDNSKDSLQIKLKE